MHSPGYYKTNYSALSIRELVRFRGLLFLPLTFILTRFKKSESAGWMPGLWAETECTKTELSERFWQATTSHRQTFEKLGFTECKVCTSKRQLDPLYRDNGGITYLHSNRSHIGLLIYNKLHRPAPIDRDIEHIIIAFSAVFQRESVSYTNTRNRFDPLPAHAVFQIPSGDPAFIYERFTAKIRQITEIPLVFQDLDSLRGWFDSNQVEIFESRVKRGLFSRMSDDEVERARRRLLRPCREMMQVDPTQAA